MYFASYKQMITDTKKLAKIIDSDYDFIVGIPRSGMIVATLLALIKQIPVTTVSGLKNKCFEGGERMKDTNRKKSQKILLIDDSFWTGESMAQAYKKVRQTKLGKKIKTIHCGCLYASEMAKNKLDYFLKIIPQPRLFEWNLMHNRFLPKTCLSLEAICSSRRDITHPTSLKQPVNIPKRTNVLAVITCIPEKYRYQIIKWLNKHQVKYEHLIMLSNNIIYDFNLMNWKSSQAKILKASLFIEFDPDQSKKIATALKIPVICLSNKRVYS